MANSDSRRRALPAALVGLVVLLSSLPAGAKTFRQEVINPDPTLGTKAEATLYVRLPQSGRPCSAVVVGPHVLVTAAHCVENGKVTILTPDSHTGKCKTPKASGPGATSPPSPVADLAACYFSHEFKQGIETISTDVSLLKKEAEVVLTGFGCVGTSQCNPSAWESKAQAGKARILQNTSVQDLFFLTVGDFGNGESALCYGDSGGPVYVQSLKGLRVVGIAQGGCVDQDVQKSAVTSLAATTTVDWFCQWVKKAPKKRAIQGLSCP